MAIEFFSPYTLVASALASLFSGRERSPTQITAVGESPGDPTPGVSSYTGSGYPDFTALDREFSSPNLTPQSPTTTPTGSPTAPVGAGPGSPQPFAPTARGPLGFSPQSPIPDEFRSLYPLLAASQAGGIASDLRILTEREVQRRIDLERGVRQIGKAPPRVPVLYEPPPPMDPVGGARRILRMGRGIGVVLGALWPSELGVDDILEPLQVPDIPRKPLPTPKPPRALDSLAEIQVNAERLTLPTRTPDALQPVIIPSAPPVATPKPTTAKQSRPVARYLQSLATRSVLPNLPSLLSQRARVPAINITPAIDPLTRIETGPLPSAGSGAGNIFRQGGSPNQYCEDVSRRKREKRRKCKTRGNVAWTSGPNKGKLAGTKCLEFK